MNDKTFLAELDAQSRVKQEEFFDHIASRLQRPRQKTAPIRTLKGAPEDWDRYELSLEARITQFVKHWELAGGHAHRLAAMKDAVLLIQDMVRHTEAKHLVMQDQPELEPIQTALLRTKEELQREEQQDINLTIWNAHGLDDAAKGRLVAAAAQADIGITAAHAAVSYTGSVVLPSSETSGRTVSLLPTMLIVIIPVSRLKTRLGEVLRPMDEWPLAERPAGVHFVSGPSRSADIENDLTIGVHGPGIVHALLIEEA